MEIMSRPSQEQLQVLVEFLEHNSDVAKGHIKTNAAKICTKRKWAEVAGRLNAIGDVKKNGDAWAKYWSEKKCGLKKRYLKQQQDTEQGLDPTSLLTDFDLRMMDLIGAKDFATRESTINPFQEPDELSSALPSEEKVTVLSDPFAPSSEGATEINPQPSTSSATVPSPFPATTYGPEPKAENSEFAVAMANLMELEKKRVEADLLKATSDENIAVSLNNVAAALGHLSKQLENGLRAIASAIASTNK